MAPPKKLATKAFITKMTKDTSSILANMDKNDVAKLIQEANYAYYNTDKPLFSDTMYDLIREHLKAIDPNHPVLKEVGAGVAVGDNRKEKLPYYMGSLDKIKNEDVDALTKFKSKYPSSYVVSDKLDGNSALLVIKDGIVKLYSRGDGKIGQNITSIIPHIKGIPTGLKTDKTIAVRGELIISREDFLKVAHKGANARNMVAGVINAKLPDLEVLSYVQFVAYELIYPDDLSMEKQLKQIKCMGLKAVYHEVVTEKQLTESYLSDVLVGRRKSSPYEVDGIVVFHNMTHKRSDGTNPDYAFAFKSIQTMEQGEVTVSHVEWNISKDGYIIPVVIFTPIALNGVTIQRANGFNGKFIKDNKIGPGSRIVIMRRGDVIPFIEKVLGPAESGEAQMPDIPYDWSSTGVDIIAKGEMAEASVALKNLEYFFDKIDVKGLSSGNVKKLFDSGLKTPKAIFDASMDDLKKVDGFKDKMAQKVFDALKERRVTLNTECVLLMDASNTMGRGMGSKKIELILGNIPKILTERYVPTVNELVSIKGIEQKTAQLFVTNLPKTFKWFEDNGFGCLSKAPGAMSNVASPKNMASPSQSPSPSLIIGAPKLLSCKMAQEQIVFTGIRNKEVEAYIIANGGKIASTVSKNTTLVVAKDPNGSSNSIVKAKELGIKVMSFEEFKASRLV